MNKTNSGYRHILLGTAVFLMVLSNLNTLFKYIGLLAILLIALQDISLYGVKKRSCMEAFVLMFIWMFGFLFQTLGLGQMLSAIFYYATLVFVALFGNHIIKCNKDILSIIFGYTKGIFIVFFYSFSELQLQLSGVYNSRMRIFGSFIHPNSQGCSVFVVIVMTVLFFLNGGKVKSKLAGFLLKANLPVMFVLLYLSKSRGCWVMTAVFLVIVFSRRMETLSRKFKVAIICIMALIFLIFLWKFISYIVTDESYSSRILGFQNLKLNGIRALFGFGMVDSQGIDYTILSEGTMEISWVKLMYKNGIMGILTFLYLIFRNCYECSVNLKKGSRIVWFALMAAFLANSLVESTFISIFNDFSITMWISVSALPYFLNVPKLRKQKKDNYDEDMLNYMLLRNDT